MPNRFKNYINLQHPGHPIQPDAQVRAALKRIQHPNYGSGSIDFGAITPIPTWAASGEERSAWMKAHWGVSANALGLEESVRNYDGGNAIEFDTEGADVRELARKLSLMLREDRIVVDYMWACDDVGKDCGMLQFSGGEQVYEYIPEPGSGGAYTLAFDVFGTSAADYGLILDPEQETYRYIGTENPHEEGQDEA